MAATYTTDKIFSNAKLVMADFDPDATAATIVDLDPATAAEGVPIENYRRFVAGLIHTVGTGSITEFAIIVGTDGDLTGATVVVTHALGSDPNAVGDTIWLECDAEQCREVLATSTHIGVRIVLGTATDECIVFFGRFEPVYPTDGLTADYVS